MPFPFERTRALVQTKEFLDAMLDTKQTPRTPRWMRGKAKAILRRYPGRAEIEMAHKALPDTFGPVPPFSRLIRIGTTLDAIDVMEAGALCCQTGMGRSIGSLHAVALLLQGPSIFGTLSLMFSRFVNSLAVNEGPVRRREKASARAPEPHGRTERGVELARYFEESPRYTSVGALAAIRAALNKAGR